MTSAETSFQIQIPVRGSGSNADPRAPPPLSLSLSLSLSPLSLSLSLHGPRSLLRREAAPSQRWRASRDIGPRRE